MQCATLAHGEATLAQEAGTAPQPRDVDLQVLQAPPAPGFVLLGIAPTSVERPGTVMDFAVSALNATDRLSALPESYAVAIAPFWLAGGGRKLRFEDYAAAGGGLQTLLRTLSLSIAATSDGETAADPDATSLGVGLRFSILQGSFDFGPQAERVLAVLEALRVVEQSFDSILSALSEDDETLRGLEERLFDATDEERPAVQAAIEARNQQLADAAERLVLERRQTEMQELPLLTSGLHLRRTGWKLDVAGGLVVDFPSRNFDNGDVSRWGGWVTGGYEARHVALLSVARVLTDRVDTDNTSFDLGGRIVLDDFSGFAVSAEGLARSFPNSDALGTDWRVALALDYAVAQNRTVSLTFGRDFEGKTSGNLLAAVHFVLGLGAKRMR
jgi:hypothetical protein